MASLRRWRTGMTRRSDDEDGVTLPATLVAGDATAAVTVAMSGSGKLDAWIDFNGNGVFDHPAEHLWGGTSQALATGSHPLTFAVPAKRSAGDDLRSLPVEHAGSLLPSGLCGRWRGGGLPGHDRSAPTTGTIIVEKQTDPDGWTDDDLTFTGDATEPSRTASRSW